MRSNLVGLVLALVLAGCAATPRPEGPDQQRLTAAIDDQNLGAIAVEWRGAAATAALRGCVVGRLVDGPDSLPSAVSSASPLLVDVVGAFAEYWRARLVEQALPQDAEAQLLRALATESIERGVEPEDSVDEQRVTDAVARTVERDGFGAFVARSAGVLDLVVWRDGEWRTYRPQLPDGTATVRLALVDPALLRGWRDWASCGAVRDVQWRGDAALVVDRTAFAEVDARAAGLAAAVAQRQLDDMLWPLLEEADREYRVLLARYAYSGSAAAFRADWAETTAQARLGRAEPAAHAAHWFTRQLRESSGGASAPGDLAAIRTAALGLLRACSARLSSRPAEARFRCLPD